MIELDLWLISNRYYFTRIEPETVLAACRSARWEANQLPLEAAVEWFSLPDLMVEGVAQVAMGALRLIWDAGALAHQVDAVARALAKAILKRVDGREILVALRAALQQVFGVQALAIEAYHRILTQELSGVPATGLIVAKPPKLWQPGDANE